jgi:7,8-dihydropterin-6-yl-methyl-4-(beta-D-ribofuranosyl)aminobenzene 5'-phosphate synthase
MRRSFQSMEDIVKHSACLLMIVFGFSLISSAQAPGRITVLYDAFGKSALVKKDWGFAALIEYGGKRILFDTGNNADTFSDNVKALGVDLGTMDFVVISHRHSDHTTGLSYLLAVNPKVKIFVPDERFDERFGIFGGSIPSSIYRTRPTLPAEMRYFGGNPPEKIQSGSPWPNADFVPIKDVTEVAPGFYLIPTVSQTPGTRDLHELSLAIRTPKGLVVVVGCSHAGIENILHLTAAVDQHLALLVGGLHLIAAPDAEVDRIALALRDNWKFERVAPGHCTGEPEFAALQKAFGDRFVYAGVGSTIPVP